MTMISSNYAICKTFKGYFSSEAKIFPESFPVGKVAIAYLVATAVYGAFKGYQGLSSEGKSKIANVKKLPEAKAEIGTVILSAMKAPVTVPCNFACFVVSHAQVYVKRHVEGII